MYMKVFFHKNSIYLIIKDIEYLGCVIVRNSLVSARLNMFKDTNYLHINVSFYKLFFSL